MDSILGTIRRYIPKKVFTFFQPAYHYTLSFLAALMYRFPSQKIKVIAVTGTKGKSSTIEILNAILEEAGYRTAISSTIRLKINNETKRNLYKMTMPGRFVIQRLIRKAVDNKCDYILIEMTSQGSLLYRHAFIDLDTLIFTNLKPEHIEAHGSYENYLNAKLAIAKSLEKSRKKNRTIVVNSEEKEAKKFLAIKIENKIEYSLENVMPYDIEERVITFTYNGKSVRSPLAGQFNLFNILAAIKTAENENVSPEKIIRAIEKLDYIPGRVEKVTLSPSENPQNKVDFEIIVDYAHTTDSLQKFYQIFSNRKNICVLGGTGGGRDIWKREEMGKIADRFCEEIILTNEDPYDEDPEKIVADVAKGIKNKKPTIIMDRRLAIREAIKKAKKDWSILITGKGTDPYIMGPKESKIPWNDTQIAKEELLDYIGTAPNI